MEDIENKLILDVQLYKDADTTYGWYIYGYFKKSKNVLLSYKTDTAVSTVVGMMLEPYREFLKLKGSITIANNKTCFETKEDAENIIPELYDVIEANQVANKLYK